LSPHPSQDCIIPLDYWDYISHNNIVWIDLTNDKIRKSKEKELKALKGRWLFLISPNLKSILI
jgi:hypothetical protein